NSGICCSLATPITLSKADTTVLSVKMKNTSTSPAKVIVACCTSEEFATVRSKIVKLVSSATSKIDSICATALASPALSTIPTSDPSKYLSINSIVFTILSGCKSTTPVIFSPGLSIASTNPADIASVTDVNTIGISFVAFNAPSALGVELAKIKSTSSATKLSEIVLTLF